MTSPGGAGAWVRPPAVAGQFYPADPDELRRVVTACLAEPPADVPAAKGFIAPHAAYIYSGPIAGHVYGRVVALRDRVRRVILAGPAHRVPLEGVGVSSASAFATPLGPVVVDDLARQAALVVPGVAIDDEAHRQEHSLEVHLPFLQVALHSFSLLPLVVGHGGAPVLAEVLEALWGGDETLIVVSTDLSHYLEDGTAKEVDRRTAQAIVDGRADAIGPHDACGAIPVRGLLAAAAEHGLSTTLLDLRTSADTAGQPDRVVGYGSFALEPSA